jgi:hypothetical protein
LKGWKEEIRKKRELIKKGLLDRTKKNRIIEDKDGIIEIISPTRVEVIPKDPNISINDFHRKFIERMDNPKYRKFYNQFHIYISEDNKKVILEK